MFTTIQANYFESPEWQRNAVDRYLQYLGPNKYKDFYNQTGRAYPDVSAQGSRYAIAWRQTFLSGQSWFYFWAQKHNFQRKS
jgi:tripeptidyl-peptidase-1